MDRTGCVVGLGFGSGSGAGLITTPSGPMQLKSALHLKELSGQHPNPQQIEPGQILVSDTVFCFKYLETNLGHRDCADRPVSGSRCPPWYRNGLDTIGDHRHTVASN